MHVERIKALADKIERLDQARFDMSIVVGREGTDDCTLYGIELADDCGTAGCVAGWACAIFSPERRPSTQLARQLLGLTADQAQSLFFPRHKGMSLINPWEAAAALRSLSATSTLPSWP